MTIPDYVITRYGKYVAIYLYEYLPDEFKVIMRQGDSRWVLMKTKEDGTPIEILGCDGGEPEDQFLVRDWKWVAHMAAKYENEIVMLKQLKYV